MFCLQFSVVARGFVNGAARETERRANMDEFELSTRPPSPPLSWCD